MHGSFFALMLAAPLAIVVLALAARHWLSMRASPTWRRRWVASRESGRLFVVLAIVVPAGFIAAVAVFSPSGGSTFLRALDAAPMAFMFAGTQLLRLARRPAGDDWKCSQCKYDLRGQHAYAPSNVHPRHDDLCPECGGRWGWPGGSVKSGRAWRPGWIALAAVCTLPLLARFASIGMGILWWDRHVLMLAPTAALVQEVLTSKSFTKAAWAELATRSPSRADARRIADALLTRPVASYFSTDEVAWLTRSLASHSIDDERVHPILSRMFKASARRGPAPWQFTLTLRSEPRAFDPIAGMDVLVFATTAGSAPGQSHALAIPANGIALYSSHTIGPFEQTPDSDPERAAGVMTVVLVPRPPGRPIGRQPKPPAAIPGGAYRLEIPFDLSVESPP